MGTVLRLSDISATLAAADSSEVLSAADSAVALASSGEQLNSGPAPALNSWRLYGGGTGIKVDATWQPSSDIQFKAVDVGSGAEVLSSVDSGQSVIGLLISPLTVGNTYRLWWKIDTGGSYPGWDDTAWHPAMTSSGEQCEWTQPSRTDPPIDMES